MHPYRAERRPLGRVAVVPGVAEERLPLRHLSDHTFAGPDYSLLPDTEFPDKLDWMYETDYRGWSRLTPYQQKTLLDLRRRNRQNLAKASTKRYEVLRNAATLRVNVPAEAKSGQCCWLEVAVTSTLSGHSFPTGFTTERQAWVSVHVHDAHRNVIFASGDVDENGDLRDEHSHKVLLGKVKSDRYLLNFQNKFIALTNKGTERSVVLPVNRHVLPINVLRPATGISASLGRPPDFRIAKGSLPPLATIHRRYPMDLPTCLGVYTVRRVAQFSTLAAHATRPYWATPPEAPAGSCGYRPAPIYDRCRRRTDHDVCARA